MGQTADDLIRSFLRWVQKPEDQEAKRYNVSKAFRRFNISHLYHLAVPVHELWMIVGVTRVGWTHLRLFRRRGSTFTLIPRWIRRQSQESRCLTP